MTEHAYQLLLLGNTDPLGAKIHSKLIDRLSDLGLTSAVLHVVPENKHNILRRDLPLVALFFGYSGATDDKHPVLPVLIEDSATIITVVSDLTKVSSEVPPLLTHINALPIGSEEDIDRVVSLVLEMFRLLRRERRLFISYKRSDSQAAANQLYDALDARGFDVFIDTRAVPPGVDFQAELWHRLSDSDVVVLIDTPGFRLSRWTTEELTRANATNIQILHLLWPGQAEDSHSAFSHFLKLTNSDFLNGAAVDSSARQLTDQTILTICGSVERLRARAIAFRYHYLVDGFCDAARDLGLSPTVQPQRWISIDLPNKKKLAAVPTIGVPTSNRIHDVFDSIAASGYNSSTAWVLYDGRGILSSWLKHLGWLDGYLPVQSVQMARTPAALEDASQ